MLKRIIPQNKSLRATLLAGAASAAMALAAFSGIARGAEAPAPQGAPTSAYSTATADIQKTLGFVPQFFEAIPAEALPGVWQEMKELQMNPKTALTGKEKELIGLGVAVYGGLLWALRIEGRDDLAAVLTKMRARFA